MSILVSLLVLSGLIFFHELGHYAAARYMGVYVEVLALVLVKNFLLLLSGVHNGVSLLSHLVDM